MIAKNPASNLLEQSQYKYSLQDVEKPNLYRELYPHLKTDYEALAAL